MIAIGIGNLWPIYQVSGASMVLV